MQQRFLLLLYLTDYPLDLIRDFFFLLCECLLHRSLDPLAFPYVDSPLECSEFFPNHRLQGIEPLPLVGIIGQSAEVFYFLVHGLNCNVIRFEIPLFSSEQVVPLGVLGTLQLEGHIIEFGKHLLRVGNPAGSLNQSGRAPVRGHANHTQQEQRQPKTASNLFFDGPFHQGSSPSEPDHLRREQVPHNRIFWNRSYCRLLLRGCQESGVSLLLLTDAGPCRQKTPISIPQDTSAD